MTSAATLKTPGTKGFLLWARENMPQVYAEYTRRGVGHLVRPGGSAGFNFSPIMGGMGDDSTAPSTDPNDEFYYLSQGSGGAPAVTSTPSAPDPASVATTSAPSNSIASIFSGLATAVGSVLLTKQQLNTQQTVVNAQLARAQAGLPPLNLSGVNAAMSGLAPTLNLGVSSSTLMPVLLIGGSVLLLAMVAGGRKAA